MFSTQASEAADVTRVQSAVQQVRCLGMAIAGISRPQRLQYSQELRRLELRSCFSFAADVERHWKALFGAPGASQVPFTYHARYGLKSFHRILSQVGANFRNILHLSTDLRFAENYPESFRPGDAYECTVGFDSMRLLGERHAVIGVSTRLEGQRAQLLSSAKDHFLVRHVSPADRRRIQELGVANAQEPDLRALRNARPILDEGRCRSYALDYPEDMGLRYGLLSGDLNIVHINPLLTRLFGYAKSFAQGLCSANFILKTLSQDEGQKLRSLSVQYCRPVYLDQTVSLHLGGDRVELVDSAGTLLIQGTWS